MKSAVRTIILNGLEQQLEALRQAQFAVRPPVHGWLQAIREGLGQSQTSVAQKLKTSRQAYADLERAEARGAISLKTLERAAGAMECELVYFILPRETAAQTFTELAQRQDAKRQHLVATEHSMALEGQAVGDLKARRLPKSPP